jgi:hypothetical protein
MMAKHNTIALATNPKTCSICGKRYFGPGNNAQPVNDGRCCDDCNETRVLPARAALDPEAP